ncbi:MAG TPA: MFS transporter [Thermoplasmata archaeon]|nr:MFS transporter [Thermoplasmata archaeon]
MAGFLSRTLARFFGLGPADVRNLAFLYFATFIMRAAAFAGVAVMQDVSARTLDALGRGLLFAVYPLAEIATVGYLGTLCDRVGRKRILVFAHLVTAAAVFLFIPSISPVVPMGVQPFLVAVCFVMFGVGAAAKVASTLAMINDHSSRANRAQLMAFFDLVTFGGLVGGFGAAFLALNAFGISDATVLAVGGIGVTVSVVMVQFLVRETPFTPETQRGTFELLRTVLRNRDIQRLLPVYVPVVALYGYVITFTDNLLGAGSEGSATTTQLLIIVASLGIPLGASLAVSGRLSDRVRLRRPFMGLGLACFGGLAILLALAARPGGGADTAQLVSRWPLIAILAAGAGTFPPAALAYLGDVVGHAVTGTAFGIYSVIFGSGLIVGPVLGGALTQALGPLAFAVIALGLIGISGVGVLFIREPLKFPRTPMGPETVMTPGKR